MFGLINRTIKKGDTDMELKYFSESGLEIFYGTDHSAGLDLPFYDAEVESICILPGERVTLKTGVYAEIPEGYYGKVDVRSSTSKLLLAPLCSTIDCDYRGNIRIVLANVGNVPQIVRRGEYLAQLIILKYEKVIPIRVDNVGILSNTKRGGNGFGHTGNTSASELQ